MRFLALLLALPLWGQITIDAGSPSDQYFTGGSLWAIPATPQGTADATLRYGVSFRYKIPASGVQVLTLRFREPNMTQPGQRIFSVSANHQPIITRLDLVAEAGYQAPLERSYVVVAAGGFVDLRFETQVRSAVVSSITLAPLISGMISTDGRTLRVSGFEIRSLRDATGELEIRYYGEVMHVTVKGIRRGDLGFGGWYQVGNTYAHRIVEGKERYGVCCFDASGNPLASVLSQAPRITARLSSGLFSIR